MTAPVSREIQPQILRLGHLRSVLGLTDTQITNLVKGIEENRAFWLKDIPSTKDEIFYFRHHTFTGVPFSLFISKRRIVVITKIQLQDKALNQINTISEIKFEKFEAAFEYDESKVMYMLTTKNGSNWARWSMQRTIDQKINALKSLNYANYIRNKVSKLVVFLKATDVSKIVSVPDESLLTFKRRKINPSTFITSFLKPDGTKKALPPATSTTTAETAATTSTTTTAATTPLANPVEPPQKPFVDLRTDASDFFRDGQQTVLPPATSTTVSTTTTSSAQPVNPKSNPFVDVRSDSSNLVNSIQPAVLPPSTSTTTDTIPSLCVPKSFFNENKLSILSRLDSLDPAPHSKQDCDHHVVKDKYQLGAHLMTDSLSRESVTLSSEVILKIIKLILNYLSEWLSLIQLGNKANSMMFLEKTAPYYPSCSLEVDSKGHVYILLGRHRDVEYVYHFNTNEIMVAHTVRKDLHLDILTCDAFRLHPSYLKETYIITNSTSTITNSTSADLEYKILCPIKESLEARLNRELITTEQKKQLCLQMLEGVKLLSDAGITHDFLGLQHFFFQPDSDKLVIGGFEFEDPVFDHARTNNITPEYRKYANALREYQLYKNRENRKAVRLAQDNYTFMANNYRVGVLIHELMAGNDLFKPIVDGLTREEPTARMTLEDAIEAVKNIS